MKDGYDLDVDFKRSNTTQQGQIIGLD